MTTPYFSKTKASITIEGSSLTAMEEEARRQFAHGFGDKQWALTSIQAQLDMVHTGHDSAQDRNEWLPGMWSATYEAIEL